MASRLPETLAEQLAVDKLTLRHGLKENANHHAKTIVDSLNGENDAERVELEIGGYVRVPTSEYEWIVVEAMMEPEHGSMPGPDTNYVMYVELVNKQGNMEVSLDIDASCGEIYNLQVSHMNNLGHTLAGP